MNPAELKSELRGVALFGITATLGAVVAWSAIHLIYDRK